MKRAWPTALVLVALSSRAAAQDATDFATPWSLRVGHSYSSATAIGQPATFVLSSDLDRPTLTLLDLGVLVQGPLGARGGLDLGARYAGGSGRTPERRSFGAIARGWQRVDRVVVAADAEYEAGDDFRQQNALAGAEATLAYGPRGLGQPWSPWTRLRWRPWIGLAWGSVLRTDVADAAENGGFLRGHARLELHYSTGIIEALRLDTRAHSPSIDVELTGWQLFDAGRGEGYVKAALSVPLAAGFSVSASLGAGRPPPSFELERRIGLGLGFSY